MANRDFKFTQAIEREVKFLAFKISDIPGAGAGGACDATPSLGIASVVADPGVDPEIVVTLEDKYNGLLSCVVTTADGAACNSCSFKSESVATNGVFTLKLGSYEFLSTGVGVNPTAFDVIQVLVTLKNTSVAR